MTHTLPFYSVRPGTVRVFHNNLDCEGAKHIHPHYWRAGDGGLTLCPACARLNASEPSNPNPAVQSVRSDQSLH